MGYTVYLTDDAAADLEELYDYLTEHNVDGRAQRILDEIETIFRRLDKQPQRGTYPKELLSLGIRDFREVFFKPYRIIYRIMENRVYVMIIADGRRDMQTLLQRRLLQG